MTEENLKELRAYRAALKKQRHRDILKIVSSAEGGVSPVLREMLYDWGRYLPYPDRTRLLLPLLSKRSGTADAELDSQRALTCAEWVIRTALPHWLRVANIEHHTELLGRLPAIKPVQSFSRDETAQALAEGCRLIRDQCCEEFPVKKWIFYRFGGSYRALARSGMIPAVRAAEQALPEYGAALAMAIEAAWSAASILEVRNTRDVLVERSVELQPEVSRLLQGLFDAGKRLAPDADTKGEVIH